MSRSFTDWEGEHLAHYGVPGMKWRQHRTPTEQEIRTAAAAGMRQANMEAARKRAEIGNRVYKNGPPQLTKTNEQAAETEKKPEETKAETKQTTVQQTPKTGNKTQVIFGTQTYRREDIGNANVPELYRRRKKYMIKGG